MSLISHKKGLTGQTIVVIIIVLVSFLLVTQITLFAMNKIEEKSLEEICRGSVAARQQTVIEKWGADFKPVPLLCKTQDKKLPYTKTDTPKVITKNIADLMAQCWYMFGEGRTTDLFDGTIGGTQHCFVCYTIKTEKTSSFSVPIKGEELFDYMKDTPYKVKRDDDNCKDFGGHCVTDKDDCDTKTFWKLDANNNNCISLDATEKHCCYSKFTCLNKGGKCEAPNSKITGYRAYPDWSCQPGKTCYIKEDNFYSYIDYIQFWGGDGRAIMSTDIAPGETYAITYGEDNKQCGIICKVTGGIGASAGLVGGVLLGTGPVGWVVLGTVGAVAAGLATYVATAQVVDWVSILTERKINTLYLSKLNDVSTYCDIDYGIGGS